MTTPTPFGASKSKVRAQAAQTRRKAALRLGDAAGAMIAQRLLAGVPVRNHETVAGYWPIRSEADPLPAMLALALRGHTLALPQVTGGGQPLAFRRWEPGAPLVPGAFGIPEPSLSAALVTPTLVLVPGLLFDRTGGRLGYGGGFYDRTIEALRIGANVTVVGIGYDAQLGDALDREPHDAPMNWIVTERRVVRAATRVK
ncbi:5-formyltetrahydrofolate cyclo-ligase [Pyruvatibacter sp.]|uniref:5-formyltetrahydrofolate cyclo-ligase n=1 Tax=Pyruvatibacter sp. TaxID=1981328 RepID=UPI0032EC6065